MQTPNFNHLVICFFFVMSLHHKYILFLLIFIYHLVLEIESLPSGRLGHSSALVGDKLYFFGGEKDGFCSNEVFYLDVSHSFSKEEPPWNDITLNAGIPFKSCWGTVSLSDINNKQTIYLFGGYTDDLVTNEEKFLPFVHSFDLISKWDVPTVKGNPPKGRSEIKSVIDDSTGKVYIFGGADRTNYFNDMYIFDTVGLSWSVLSLADAPSQRAGYTATLLTNGIILYIGGYSYQFVGDVFIDVDISQIFLFDTKSSTWSNKVRKIKFLIILR